MASSHGVSVPKKEPKKWWQRWFHLASGFDMQFFVLLMIILIVGLATLLIGGTVTWFVCSGLIPAGELGDSVYPLYEAALATGKLFVAVALFVGSISLHGTLYA